MIAAYDQHYSLVNPWAPYCMTKKPGQGIIAHDAYPQEELVKSEYYNDFLLPMGVRSSAGCTIDKDKDRILLVSTMTVDDDPDALRPVADQFTRIAPHLKRAADFYRKGPKLRAVTELGGSLFEALHIGTLMVGEAGRVKVVSETAQKMMAGSSAVRISPIGRASLRDGAAQSVLNDMLERNYSGPKSVSFAAADIRLTLVHIGKDRLSFYFEGPTVMVLVEGSKPVGHAFDADEFSTAYRLTMAETRAMVGILSGMTVDEMADAASLSRETIRSQTKSLYAKVAVRSEAELLRLVFTGRSGK
jgi:DNA-binding CsgD family transcriptional regulator